MVNTYYPELDSGIELSDPTIHIKDLPAWQMSANVVDAFLDGDKFYNGFGDTYVFTPDYWTLRARSSQLFESNLYARGILRRFVTNVINTGLGLESTVMEDVLRAELGAAFEAIGDPQEWTENTENRFTIWANSPILCDYKGEKTFGEIQRSAYLEALIGGDVLVILHVDRKTGLPKIQLVKASKVSEGLNSKPAKENTIEYGVEQDKNGRQVAYWVEQDDGTSKRIPAFGPRTGRRIAWLMYGTERRLDAVRGNPILSIVLQSLKEIDRYRDAEQRAAVINAIVAMFIKKTQDKIGTKPMSGGAQRHESIQYTDSDGTQRTYQAQKHVPGLVMETLQTGEEPVPFNTQRPNTNFSVFESAIVNAMAWAFETPPEVMTLAFSKNYSASRGAVNEYKIFLNKERGRIADGLHNVVYESWFLSMVLLGKLNAPGFLEAWRNPQQYDIYGGWLSSDWTGAIKPSVDLLKEVNAYKVMVEECWITNEKAAKELTGTKYSKNVRRIEAENAQKKAAREALGAAVTEPIQIQDEADEPEETEEEMSNRLSVVGD